MFEFRYDKLMEVKEKLIEHKQRQLEAALSSLHRAINEVLECEREIADRFNDLTGRCLTGNEFSALTNYLAFLDVRKADLSNTKKEKANLVTTLRTELCTLEMELKILEKLKLRIFQTIKKARNRKEQKVMDDLALRTELK